MNEDRLDDLSEVIFAIADKLSDRIIEQRKHKTRSTILTILLDNLNKTIEDGSESWLKDFMREKKRPDYSTIDAILEWLKNYITEYEGWLE